MQAARARSARRSGREIELLLKGAMVGLVGGRGLILAGADEGTIGGRVSCGRGPLASGVVTLLPAGAPAVSFVRLTAAETGAPEGDAPAPPRSATTDARGRYRF